MEGEMKTELAVTQKETQLAHSPEFSSEQVRLLGQTVAKDCNQDELAFFLNVCKLKRLDPFTGQVHCVKRWDSTLGAKKMSIQVGIDGFRVIAARTNDLAGISEPEFDDEEQEYPKWARVTVYRYGRDNEKIPYTAKARYNEYVQTKQDGSANHMWATKPYIMLGKCAEALALRKAFPDELSGMYSDDEMGQADNDTHGTTPEQAGKKPPVQQPQRASEVKKQQEAKQSTQAQNQGAQEQNTSSPMQQPQAEGLQGTKEVSGIIESAQQAKSGTMWITVKGEPLVVAVDEKNIDADMIAGNFIKFRGLRKWANPLKTEKNPKGEFWSLAALIELSPVQDGEPVTEKVEATAEMASDAEAVADALFGGKQEPDGKAAVQGLVDKGMLTPASQLPTTTKPGTIGNKRAKRLYAIAGQNKKTTGFTDENIHKVLAALPNPLEHLSDLEVSMYEQFEKFCTGDSDWTELLKDE